MTKIKEASASFLLCLQIIFGIIRQLLRGLINEFI